MIVFMIMSLTFVGDLYGSTRRNSRSFSCGYSLPPQVQTDQSRVAQLCAMEEGAIPVRSATCVEWVAKKAEEAFSSEERCRGRVTVPLLMCIFKKEVGSYGANPCVKNGCGLSQITTAGVSTVKRGLFNLGLNKEYDYFWDLVGRPEEKENKCELTRTSAKDRDTAIIMAATHLCAQAKGNRWDPSYYNLARDYNGSYRKYTYARDVTKCMKRNFGVSDPGRRRIRVAVKSQCRRYGTCGGSKLKGKNSAARPRSSQNGWGGNT